MTTANKITVTRILLIPVFVMMAIYYGRGVQSGHPQEWQRIATIFLFLAASASDGLDGYVARRFNQRSAPGSGAGPDRGQGAAARGDHYAELQSNGAMNSRSGSPCW